MDANAKMDIMNYHTRTKLFPELLVGFAEHHNFYYDFLKNYQFTFQSKNECKLHFESIIAYLEQKFEMSKSAELKYEEILKGSGLNQITIVGYLIIILSQGIDTFNKSNLIKHRCSLFIHFHQQLCSGYIARKHFT